VGLQSEGRVLGGKYRLVRQIGEGGMGTVWEAEHVELGRHVAVKLLRADCATTGVLLARFRREAQIAGRLGHDNVCEVLDVGTAEGGEQFLVLPLLRGEPLSALIAREGPLSVARAIDIGVQVLSGLEAAHQAGVVHRDLKPGNVFITAVGDRGDFAKLLDFGVSKVLAGSPLPVSTLTRAGGVAGTPHYMAPEQARGHRDQDHRVDVYAAGVILYEMLTGRLPFEGDSDNDLLIRIVTEPFKPPSALRPDLPPALGAIVLRAMSRDRDRRFSDAASMRTALQAQRSAPAATPRVGRTQPDGAADAPLPRTSPRTWRLAAACVGVAVAVILAAALLTASTGASPSRSARTHRSAAAEPRSAARALAPRGGAPAPIEASSPAPESPGPPLRADPPPATAPAEGARSKAAPRRAPALIRGPGGAVVVTQNR
jgi:serine/threonine-protein kinase